MKKCLSLILSVLLMLSCCVFTSAEEEIVELYINMTVTMEDGVICADLVDDQGGTVSAWPVSLEIDGEQVDTQTTDEYGTASFHYVIPESTREIACVAKDGQFENYRFIGCTVYLEYVPNEDETETEGEEPDYTEETDSTEGEQAETTTAPPQTTTKVVVATTTTVKKPANLTPMTTTVSGDRVAIGVNADNALLIASASTQAEFQARARMWMDHNVYRSLVPSSSSTLQLQLNLNEQAGDMARLIAAKNADAAYASFADEDVKGYAMDLSIVYVDENAIVPLDIEDGEYIIEIPVPASLRSSEKYAVAVCTADGLSSLIEVKPSGGMLNFTIQRFQTLAIVGFGNAAVSLDLFSSTPWLLVLVIVLGIILIAGGIVLLILVVFRKKSGAAKSKKTDTSDEAVSLEAQDEDVISYASVPQKEKRHIPAPTETRDAKQESVDSVKAETTTESSKTNISNDELDDLLKEVLNDLESI